MKVYQGGPMRDYPLYNFNTFELGDAYLSWLGHDVVSPHNIDMNEGFVRCDYNWGWPEGFSWVNFESVREFTAVTLTDKFSIEEALKRDIAVITTCDAVSFLPGWEKSAGCRIEDYVRNACGLPRYIHEPFRYFHLHSQLAIGA